MTRQKCSDFKAIIKRPAQFTHFGMVPLIQTAKQTSRDYARARKMSHLSSFCPISPNLFVFLRAREFQEKALVIELGMFTVG